MAAVTTDVEVMARHVALANRDVVDVGCGGGWLARTLAARGARVTALEISEDQLAAARAADDGSGVVYAVGRAEALPLDDGSQDVVVLMRSLHHVAVGQMGAALAQARRVVRPDGIVYVAEPLPEGDFYALVSVIEDETGVREAARAAVADAARAGLEPVATERYEVGSVLADLDALRRRMVAVDPARAPRFDARRDELARVFAAGGEPDPADRGTLFRQAQRADVLRPRGH